MLSLSKNEFNVIRFLIRNFSRRFTIRNIGAELGISAAGAHAALKKLEKSRIVKAERLGTGLFYYVNLDDKVARHLAAVSLLDCSGIRKIKTEDIEKESRAAVFDGKRLLAITSNEDYVKDICYRELKEVKVVCVGEEEFSDALRDRDKDVISILEKGCVLFGEDIVLDAIKRVMR
ncbi:hypothetical protein KY366_04790 [Candidatus Woesearchaeota archaeon]|nr:hypothetical protein [Candidatus Woesearchaeota archaeon]